jgi:hypothetical protein
VAVLATLLFVAGSAVFATVVCKVTIVWAGSVD